MNGNPEVFPRKFHRLLELKEEGFMIDLEFNIVCKEAGCEVLSVPVEDMEASLRPASVWAAACM